MRGALALRPLALLAVLVMASVGKRARGRSGGAVLTLAQLRELATRVGFPDPNLAAAVAMAESGGDPDARHIVTSPGPGALPERSFGLWQVNVLAWPMFDAIRLAEPEYNARAALLISQSPRGWSNWSTYTSGDYRRFLGGSP